MFVRALFFDVLIMLLFLPDFFFLFLVLVLRNAEITPAKRNKPQMVPIAANRFILSLALSSESRAHVEKRPGHNFVTQSRCGQGRQRCRERRIWPAVNEFGAPCKIFLSIFFYCP